MSNLLLPFFTAIDGNGLAMAGAKLEFYETGSSTPKNTYSDASLTAPYLNANPVVADANGLFGPIYLTSGDYKVILKNSAGTTIATRDPVSGLGAADTLTTRGDLLTRDAAGYKRLPIGAATYVLTSDGVDPSWAAPIIPRGSIQGLTYANNVSDATNDLDIAVGAAMDGTNARMLVLGSALTKRSDAAWAVGTNAGALDDIGSAGNNDFYIWLIQRSDTGVVDILFSLSSTAPTMPTSYNFKRLIGWFRRSGGTIVAFKVYEIEGGGIEYKWSAPRSDVALANTLTTARRLDPLSVPANISVQANVTASAYDASSDGCARICCPDETDAAPTDPVSGTGTANIDWVPTTGLSIFNGPIRTSAIGQVACRSTVATTDVYNVVTNGFQWGRR